MLINKDMVLTAIYGGVFLGGEWIDSRIELANMAVRIGMLKFIEISEPPEV